MHSVSLGCTVVTGSCCMHRECTAVSKHRVTLQHFTTRYCKQSFQKCSFYREQPIGEQRTGLGGHPSLLESLFTVPVRIAHSQQPGWWSLLLVLVLVLVLMLVVVVFGSCTINPMAQQSVLALGGNTALLARRSDEALGVRVSVAHIAPSLLDIGHAATYPVVLSAAGTSLRAISDLSGPSNTEKQGATNDIGIYIGKTVDDFTKRNLLQDNLRRLEDYVFPYTFKKLKGKEVHRHPTHQYLEMFEWPVFSDISRGLFCKYCALFAPGHVGGFHKTVQLSQLATRPLAQFSKLLGKDGYMNMHAEKTYHKHAVAAGKTNIYFRGHRDDGLVLSSNGGFCDNEGSFRELVPFRTSSGDNKLEQYLKNISARTIKKPLDLKTAEETLRDTITTLKAKRARCAQEFLHLFSEVRAVSLELRTELKVERIAKTQVHRCNTPDPDLQSGNSDKASLGILLQVLATLPVSVATAERTFSTLKRINTWLRITMNEDRLIGLALLATHRDIAINPDQVIGRFAMSGNRRLKFVLKIQCSIKLFLNCTHYLKDLYKPHNYLKSNFCSPHTLASEMASLASNMVERHSPATPHRNASHRLGTYLLAGGPANSKTYTDHSNQSDARPVPRASPSQ
ncbi:hypothetical protein PR048_025802 [Dryococelus australis]|uniref:HAT C-terminal dimerisation domain-containing protein n=1 Tax=Dryococelus australis TaxID=614101 RepID=A0ABQ9GJL2_9NEOP|nr:hypothetical protein PR048_025802 [Dryococelus australis]